MKTVTIVIPFYNEEKNLEILVPELVENIKTKPKDIDISFIFVNDNSNDNSESVIKRNCDYFDKYYLINLSKKSGQTGAFKAAFEKCETEYIIRMDSDLQDHPCDLNLFFNKIITDEPDLIMGLREARKHSKLLRIASQVYDLIILLLFNTPLHSNSGSFVAFKTKYVKNLPWYKNDHRYLPLIVIYRGASKISEVFVRHRERIFGQTNYPKIRKIIFGFFEVLFFILRLRIGVYKKVK